MDNSRNGLQRLTVVTVTNGSETPLPSTVQSSTFNVQAFKNQPTAVYIYHLMRKNGCA